MSVLSCRNCGVDVAGEPLLRNVNFTLEDREKVGLVGPNGVGKSTLLRACLGEVSLESGAVQITRSSGFLPQTPDVEATGTVQESMLAERSDLIALWEEIRSLEEKMEDKLMDKYASLSERFENEGGYALEALIRRILTGLGLEKEINTPVSHLSGGQKTRLALSKLLLHSPTLLILDEPTNHLDIMAMEWLEGFLKDYPGAVIIVSHDRYFLDHIVSRILSLEKGALKTYSGNFSEYELQRALEEKTVTREAERLAKKVARLEEFIRRNKAGVNSRQARSRERQLRKLTPMQVGKTGQNLKFSTHSGPRSGDQVLNIDGLKISFGPRVLFQDVELSLGRGDKLAVLGKNGVGKTSLLKAILQRLPYEGNIRIGANVVMAYYSQEHEGLHNDLTVIGEIRTASNLKDPEIRSLLARYGFREEEVFKPVRTLSGGEKSRLALCKLFLNPSNLLLLDEPTNHLDNETREVLEDLLMDYEGTILVVSHDRYFLDKIINKVALLTPGRLNIYEGDYTDYLEKRSQEKNCFSNEKQFTRGKDNREEAKKSQRWQKRIQQMETNIAELEFKLKEMETELAASAADYQKAMDLHEACEEVRQKLNEAFDLWAEACE
ncbi:MAG: ABC-F family ATP-binding cassette domain-containing protein [Desulfitobacteriaceae bacterium]|nr:ABC-F family ATP-binding cassette domain-containing protein [Desulfitobacteriaceae bacterium]MDD4345707.1 ABC-F family ATP-binding cassette domain-containing protein [Desulfitobacteriaceae bacterium]MDD4401357.1 ABC-F family ATP-binding cassette domain-containing protein [Desulfitobacteriaceae bacterium]